MKDQSRSSNARNDPKRRCKTRDCENRKGLDGFEITGTGLVRRVLAPKKQGNDGKELKIHASRIAYFGHIKSIMQEPGLVLPYLTYLNNKAQWWRKKKTKGKKTQATAQSRQEKDTGGQKINRLIDHTFTLCLTSALLPLGVNNKQ